MTAKSRTRTVVAWALAVFTVVAFAFFVLHAARAILFPFPFDYGEGPLLEQGRILARGGNIYRAHVDDYPFLIANYPPVFPAILAVANLVLGPSYAVCRIVTTLATLACAYFVSSIVKSASGSSDRLARATSAALFLACPYVVFWSALVRIDLVALAFALAALARVARRPSARATPFVAAALLALACLTRQSHLLAGPFAVTVALFGASRIAAAKFVACFAAIFSVAVGALELASHGGFFFHVVSANVNAFSFGLLQYFSKDFLEVGWPLFVVALVFVVARDRDVPGRRLVLAYLAAATVSALTIGKVGSHVNYFVEEAAALAVVAGVSLTEAVKKLRVLRSVLVACGAASFLAFSIFHPENIESKLARRAEFRALQDLLRADHGLVLADETMGMLPITNHDILLQPFEFTQLAKQGRWNQERVVDDIARGRFAMILINDTKATPESWTRERWTERMLATIHDRYEPTGVLADATIYRPKTR